MEENLNTPKTPASINNLLNDSNLTNVKKQATVVSKKVNNPKITDLYLQLSQAFLLTPDMTSTIISEKQNDNFQEENNSEVEPIPETRCICNLTHGSPLMIQCDSCKKWLHEDCVHLKNPKDADPFICIFCQHEISKSVKNFVRRKMKIIQNIVSKIEKENQSPINLSNYWKEIQNIIDDTKNVLELIPTFLNSTEE